MNYLHTFKLLVLFFKWVSTIWYGSKTAQIVSEITLFSHKYFIYSNAQSIRDCISLALIKIRQSKCQFQSVCKVHSGVLFKRGEYTWRGISRPHLQTTHAYLEEEQQKLEGITATQIVGLSIRQNELNWPNDGEIYFVLDFCFGSRVSPCRYDILISNVITH